MQQNACWAFAVAAVADSGLARGELLVFGFLFVQKNIWAQVRWFFGMLTKTKKTNKP